MAITTPGDKTPATIPSTPTRKPPGYIHPTPKQPAKPAVESVYRYVTQDEQMTALEQQRHENALFPHMYPVDNFALTRNSERSNDYALACSDEGFSYAPARYTALLKDGFTGFNVFLGVKNAFEFMLQSSAYSFRDIFLNAIDSRATYYSNDFRADMPKDLIAELCRINGYSAHLNARVMYEIVKVYNDFYTHVNNHRADAASTKNLKEQTMPAATTTAPASDSTTSTDSATTINQGDNMNTNQAQEQAVEAAAAAGEATNNAAASAAEATTKAGKKFFGGTGITMDKSKLFAKKALDGASKGVVIGSTAIVAGELAFFGYQTIRGNEYRIGDGLRTVGALFSKKVVQQ